MMNDEPPIFVGKFIFHIDFQLKIYKLCFSILVVILGTRIRDTDAAGGMHAKVSNSTLKQHSCRKALQRAAVML